METDEDGDSTPNVSPTFGRDGSFHVKEAVGSASISPSGRDVVLASPEGLHIIDLNNPWTPPHTFRHRQPWAVADVQWSPFATRDYRIASTSNKTALIWNLDMPTSKAPIEFVLRGHSRAITDINFSAHDPDILATCSIDSFVHCWDLRTPQRPVISYADWFAGASQVKWNRQDRHILASSHDRYLRIWDDRKGAEPVKTIEAHSTKIYGIDWNRTSPSRILTCSLDQSIKLWDLTDPEDTPMRVIRTSYPVWRARHTPFGAGILAMPQRGSNALHLYDRRLRDGHKQDEIVKPVRVFEGHDSSVKEFLWRTQGAVEYNIDNRDFQLVSWGATDNKLLLHRVDEPTLNEVGYKKGQEAAKRITFTRIGAKYRTFHNPAPLPGPSKSHGLSSLFRGAHGIAEPALSVRSLAAAFGQRSTLGMREANAAKQSTNPIDWMKGVKIGDSITESAQAPALRSSDAPPFSTAESLGDEITQAGRKFKKILFEHIDVPSRCATLSLNGPWGLNGSPTHVRVTLQFPRSYPEQSPPDVMIEKTSSISEAAVTRLGVEIRAICDAYLEIGRGSLEALIPYLLGDSDLETTIAWVNRVHNAMQASLERLDEGSSSDDDEGLIEQPGSPILPPLESSNNELPVNTNANVPLPKACGAIWTEDGRLLCFFPRKEGDSLLLGSGELGNASGQLAGKSMFDSLGWPDANIGSKRRSDSSSSDISTNSTDDSSRSSISELSGLSNDADSVWPSMELRPGGLLKMSTVRSISLRSVAQLYNKRKADASQQTISLQNHDDLFPSKRYLAEEYRIWGEDLSDVCVHNAGVASRGNMEDLATIWRLVGLLVEDNVPLQSLPHPDEESPDILVVARRSLVHVKRNDSGLDLAFDEPPSVANPTLTASVQWGQHALGSGWLVRKLFDHFEREADAQMLGMLSCILSNRHYAPGIGHQSQQPHTNLSLRDSHTRLSCLYYDHEELALTELRLKVTSGNDQETTTAQGSSGTVDGYEEVWSSDGTEVDPKSSYSERVSPLLMTRVGSRNSISGQSFSSSPEEHKEQIRRSQSMLSTRLAASFSRPFSFMTSTSASPPSQPRTPELSTSAPSGAGSGLQFIKHDAAHLPGAEMRSGLAYEIDASALEDSESNGSDDDLEAVCTYKTTEDFDDAMHTGLLMPIAEPVFRAWREAYAHMLYVWQLPIARAELLKFNNSRSASAMNTSERITCFQEFTGTTRTIPRVYCTICYEPMLGLYRSCLYCGHSAHIECMEDLGKDWDEELGCEAGCGCSCQGAQNTEELSISEATLSHFKETLALEAV